mmetsp:Transcript_93172/g.168315  ORF Transcript_93172/g.168315 Transcript_93172/m.168315 type:complete len:216 (+) Transcript_93172:542-1189(+)
MCISQLADAECLSIRRGRAASCLPEFARVLKLTHSRPVSPCEVTAFTVGSPIRSDVSQSGALSKRCHKVVGRPVVGAHEPPLEEVASHALAVARDKVVFAIHGGWMHAKPRDKAQGLWKTSKWTRVKPHERDLLVHITPVMVPLFFWIAEVCRLATIGTNPLQRAPTQNASHVLQLGVSSNDRLDDALADAVKVLSLEPKDCEVVESVAGEATRP